MFKTQRHNVDLRDRGKTQEKVAKEVTKKNRGPGRKRGQLVGGGNTATDKAKNRFQDNQTVVTSKDTEAGGVSTSL